MEDVSLNQRQSFNKLDKKELDKKVSFQPTEDNDKVIKTHKKVSTNKGLTLRKTLGDL